jgi:hypothetical protein
MSTFDANQKFTYADLCLSLVLSVIHTGSTDGKIKNFDKPQLETALKTVLGTKEKNAEPQFLKFLLIAREINQLFTLCDEVSKSGDKSSTALLNKIKSHNWLTKQGARICLEFFDNNIDFVDAVGKVNFSTSKVFDDEIHKNIIREFVVGEFKEATPLEHITEHKFDTSVGGTTINIVDLLGGAGATVPDGVKEAEGGGFRSQHGGSDLITKLLIEIAKLSPLNDPTYICKKLSGVYGIIVPPSIKHFRMYNFSVLPAVSSVAQNNFGNKLFTLKWENGKLSLVNNATNKPEPYTLIDFSNLSDDDTKALGLSKSIGRNAVLSACVGNNDKNECLKIIDVQVNTENDMVNVNMFNGVNPRLVVDLLEKLRWGWNLNKQSDGSVVRSYVESFDKYKEIRSKDGDTVPNLKKHAQKYLETCAKYINSQYSELLNDGSFVEREMKKSQRPTKELKFSYPIIGYPNAGSEIATLRSFSNIGTIPQIINRNNAWARLAAGLTGGNQYVMPAGFNLYNEQQNGGALPMDLIGNNLSLFYESSINRLVSALSVANKKLDDVSANKINVALNNFKFANSDISEKIAIMQTYNRINAQTRDSKYEVSLEDMQRFNKQFESSITSLNKSEIKLAKVITSLQESVIEAFKNKMSSAEAGV